MARNMNKSYLAKLVAMSKTPTPNGYTCDVANYIYNPHRNHEYPNFKKIVSDDGETVVERVVRYFKFWDGDGRYEAAEYSFSKDHENDEWVVMHEVRSEILEDHCRRFSLAKLLSFC